MLPLLLSLACQAGDPEAEHASAPSDAVHHLDATHPDAVAHHTILAVKVLGGLVHHDGHAVAAVGASVFAERVLVEHLLEAELAVGWVRHDGFDAMPVEGLLKAALFHAGITELHAGAGGVVAVPLDGSAPSVGAIATVDLFAWVQPRTGLLLEVNVQDFPSKHGNVLEVESGVGLATRF